MSGRKTTVCNQVDDPVTGHIVLRAVVSVDSHPRRGAAADHHLSVRCRVIAEGKQRIRSVPINQWREVVPSVWILWPGVRRVGDDEQTHGRHGRRRSVVRMYPARPSTSASRAVASTHRPQIRKCRTMADQIPDFIRPGAVVEWDTWCGTAVTLVTYVDQSHVTLRSPDGVTDSLDASAHSTLAEQVNHLRPSTRKFIDKNPGYTSALWD